MQEALANMTAAEYKEFLETAMKQIQSVKLQEQKDGKPIDSQNDDGSENQFSMSNI